MYKELNEFVCRIVKQPALWKDGELWTAVVGGVGFGVWTGQDPLIAENVRSRFGDILTVTSIVFGFAMTTLVFYIQAASGWSKDVRVKEVAAKVIDWHIWTIITMLVLIAYLVCLWLAEEPQKVGPWIRAFEFGILAFLVLYSGFQILNHTLTVGWIFRRSSDLEKK